MKFTFDQLQDSLKKLQEVAHSKYTLAQWKADGRIRAQYQMTYNQVFKEAGWTKVEYTRFVHNLNKQSRAQ